MFGPLCGTAWGKRAETWKIFCRSELVLDDHLLVGRGDETNVSFGMTLELSCSVDPECFHVKKVEAVPLQAWSDLEGSRKLRFPDFMTRAQDGGKTVNLTHRPPLAPGNAPGTHFC